ncbi:trehalose utilization protein ThuA, partial [Listeria booriae]|uniref:ThuA domain-containing protein n=2 Tax=Listeria TaxID=1637 RepID=UPI0016290061
ITYKRGNGRIFYFQPGHESYPTYHHPEIQQVIINGVHWCGDARDTYPAYGNHQPLEKIGRK